MKGRRERERERAKSWRTKKRSCQNSIEHKCITLFTISYGPTTPISVCITLPLPFSKGNGSKWKNMKRGHNALQAIHKYRHMHNMYAIEHIMVATIQKAQHSFLVCCGKSALGVWVVQGLLQKSCDCTYGITISTFCCVSCVCTYHTIMGHFFGRHVHAISLNPLRERNNTFVIIWNQKNSQFYNLCHGKLVHNIQE